MVIDRKTIEDTFVIQTLTQSTIDLRMSIEDRHVG